MQMKWFCLLVFFATTCSSSDSNSKSSKSSETTPPQTTATTTTPSFSDAWNNTFHFRTTETGEILSIGAVFSTAGNVYVYDQAENRVVIFDTTLSVTDSVSFPSIGRNRYIGDDFVVADDQFIFLNSIDHRLELFNTTNGMHQGSIPLPRNLFRTEKQRSRRIVDRLFLDDNTLYIGNYYHIIPFDRALGKKVANAKTLSSPKQRQWLLYRKRGTLTRDRNGTAYADDSAVYRDATTHYPLSGKRHFTLGSRYYAIEAGKDSVYISELKQP